MILKFLKTLRNNRSVVEEQVSNHQKYDAITVAEPKPRSKTLLPHDQQEELFEELLQAVWMRNVPQMVYLINKGLDINQFDHVGKTVLHYAVREEYADMIAELIMLGADLTIRDYHGMGVTPEEYAKKSGHYMAYRQALYIVSEVQKGAGYYAWKNEALKEKAPTIS